MKGALVIVTFLCVSFGILSLKLFPSGNDMFTIMRVFSLCFSGNIKFILYLKKGGMLNGPQMCLFFSIVTIESASCSPAVTSEIKPPEDTSILGIKFGLIPVFAPMRDVSTTFFANCFSYLDKLVFLIAFSKFFTMRPVKHMLYM